MRRFLLVAGLCLIGTAGILARQPAQNQAATIEKLADTLYVVRGGGGNTAAFLVAMQRGGVAAMLR